MRIIFNNQVRFISILFVAIIVAVINVAPSLAFSPKRDLTNQQTYSMLEKDELILIDIREPFEWKQSGVAKGALTIPMTDPKFIDIFTQLRIDNPEKTIAFICASGRRSEVVRAELAKRGFKNIYSVFGGTTGNGVTSWVKEGLPMVSYPDGEDM